MAIRMRECFRLKGRGAHELFQEGFEIFALYPDDTEAMLDDEGELDTMTVFSG